MVAVTLNFFLPRMIKGNPVDLIVSQMMQGMADSDTTKAVYEQFARQFGLDKPLIVQFFIYLDKQQIAGLKRYYSDKISIIYVYDPTI